MSSLIAPFRHRSPAANNDKLVSRVFINQPVHLTINFRAGFLRNERISADLGNEFRLQNVIKKFGITKRQQ